MSIKRNGCLFICLYCVSAHVHALFIYDPVNLIENKIIAVNSTKNILNQIKEIKYQFSMYENDLKNMKTLKYNFWDNTKNHLYELKKIQNKGMALSYFTKNPEKNFNSIFSLKNKNYLENLNKMSEAVLKTILNSYSGINFQAESFLEEEKINQRLHDLNEKSKGLMEVLQILNLFSGMQISQLQKMRELIMNQINVQNANLAFQIKKEELKNQVITQWLKAVRITIPKYGSGIGFGADTLDTISI